jgi:hypothetical protein
MPDPYLSFGPDPGHDENISHLTADALGIGRLRPAENIDEEWVLSSVAPANYGTVSFEAENRDDAEQKAIAWVRANAEQALAWMDDEDDD